MGEPTASTWAAGKLVHAALFCAAGIVVNIVGSQLAANFQLPVYFDSLGTVLTAAFGGYIPGIAVGYLTNIFTSAFDGSNLYYGVINVLIAMAVTFFAHRGWLDHLRGVLGLIVVLSIIGGGLGSLLTWFLFGEVFGNGVSASLAQALYTGAGVGVGGMFGAQLAADFVLDLLDKTIVVTCAIIIIRLFPKRFVDMFDFAPWQQVPLTDREMSLVRSTKSRTISLGTKIVILVSVVMAAVAIATTSISFLMYHRANIDAQGEAGFGITNLMAQAVDANRVPEYLQLGDAAPGYADVERALHQIRSSFPDVEYLYVYQIREDGCHVVFDLDTDDTPGSDPGEVIPFDESFAGQLPALLAGEPIDPIVTNDTYGWLLTVCQPLYDANGDCACYVAADISMRDVMVNELGFLARIISLFTAFFIVVCAVTLWLARYNILLPVNSIALATSSFAFDDGASRNGSVEHLRHLGIRTGDEVENLYQASIKTAEDTIRFIAETQEKGQTIDRMQSNLIMVMADLVESRDKFTGDHIKNTAAYVKITLEKMREKGIYADEMTDDFISNTIRSAPLHDIGKIVVSDTILNKPGRLTDEEFKIMQNHTLAGRDILRSAVGAVSESSYLDEAQNLAAYHHEKWNGQGYPCGLSGRDIPLSARVMAVADVFDALVSKRSYKEGFPIEKALDIIREGVGSHFDPLVAEAFLEAEDEVRKIAESRGAGGGEGAGGTVGAAPEAATDGAPDAATGSSVGGATDAAAGGAPDSGRG